jgi:Dna[CI] antecedent DciA-like protein
MEPVRSGLRQIMADFLRKQAPEEAALLAWPLVCGKEVAARCQPLRFSEGNLIVEVPDATWQNQLRSFAGRYLSEYESLLGPLVRRVEFKLKHSAIGNQRPGKEEHSALSSQQSAKPVSSASANTASNAQRRIPSKKIKKG